MNLLMNRNPFTEFDHLFRTMERNLESSWRGATAGIGSLPMDVYEKPDAFYMRASIPGVREEDVDLSIEKDVVTLKGTMRCDYEGEGTKVYLLETPYGSFTRSVRLPENCQSDAAEAHFDRGVLTVRIPKAEKPQTVRSIPIRQSINA
ncbi:MAG: Hsp20/alpha crystallin family protein, partial [Verrucomicrobiaceae bacterium]